MTAIPALEFEAPLDRAVGSDAELLRQLSRPSDTSWSFMMDERRVDLFQSLEGAFADAREDDWDGDGSAAADPLSYVYARALLLSLPQWVPNPEVSVDRDGELTADWDFGPRAVFSVSLGRDGTLTYAGLFGTRKSHGVEPFTDRVQEFLAHYLVLAKAQGSADPVR